MIIDYRPVNLEDSLVDYPDHLELPVVMQREMTTYLHRSLPMCIMLTNDNYRGWFNTNFVQIFSNKLENGEIELNYLTPRDGYCEIAEVISLGYPLLDHVPDFVSYMIECINKGYYFVVHIDEFYIPDKGMYEETHFVHASLCYGYDMTKREFYGIGFDEDMTFRKMTFSFDAFREAYEESKSNYMPEAFWCEWSAVQLIKPKTPDVAFPFDLRRFTDELSDYLTSRADMYKYYSFEFDVNNAVFGMDVYKLVEEKLEEMKQGDIYIDYRAIHLLAERSRGLVDRFSYISKLYDISDELKNDFKKYEEIGERFNKVRLRFMAEFSHVEKREQINEHKREELDWTIKELRGLSKDEKEILGKIHSELLLIK